MRERLRLAVRGAVQGVGFRPFVYRLARALDLAGWVLNSPHGVIIEVEGRARARSTVFCARLEAEPPPRAAIVRASRRRGWSRVGFRGFEIRDSDERRRADGARAARHRDLRRLPARDVRSGQPAAIAIRSPTARNCGPRFSIIDALPYDRARTSMRGFTMCPACAARVRRSGRPPLPRPAQRLSDLRPAAGAVERPRSRARRARRGACAPRPMRFARGRIVAVKGLGGFHLMVDAASEAPSSACARGSIARRSRSR